MWCVVGVVVAIFTFIAVAVGGAIPLRLGWPRGQRDSAGGSRRLYAWNHQQGCVMRR